MGADAPRCRYPIYEVERAIEDWDPLEGYPFGYDPCLHDFHDFFPDLIPKTEVDPF